MLLLEWVLKHVMAGGVKIALLKECPAKMPLIVKHGFIFTVLFR
jgi:hypothetical protein